MTLYSNEEFFFLARVCSIHFEKRFCEKPLQQVLLGYSPKKGRKLTNDAIPTLNLPKKMKTSTCVDREARVKKRTNKKCVKNILEEST
jgi:hypothetical protein